MLISHFVSNWLNEWSRPIYNIEFRKYKKKYEKKKKFKLM